MRIRTTLTGSNRRFAQIPRPSAWADRIGLSGREILHGVAFQGDDTRSIAEPRALPWATMFRPRWGKNAEFQNRLRAKPNIRLRARVAALQDHLCFIADARIMKA